MVTIVNNHECRPTEDSMPSFNPKVWRTIPEASGVFDEKLDAELTAIIDEQTDVKRDHFKMSKKRLGFLLDMTNRYLRYEDLITNSNPDLFMEFAGLMLQGLGYEKRTANGLMGGLKNMMLILYKQANRSPPHFPFISIMEHIESDDSFASLEAYKGLNFDIERVGFYQGWIVLSKDNVSVYFQLANFYSAYGAIYTKKLYQALKSHGLKTLGTTLKKQSNELTFFMKTMIELCPSLQELNYATSPKELYNFVKAIFLKQLSQTKAKHGDVQQFYKFWRHAEIKVIELFFVKPKIWPEPRFPFYKPKFGTSEKPYSHQKTERGNAFNDKLITRIPLNYTDSQAIEEILEHVERDIEFVINNCRKLHDQTMTNFDTRQRLALKGKVRHKSRSGIHSPIDISKPENFCATWNHYTYSPPRVAGWTSLLQKHWTPEALRNEFALINSESLYPAIYLLIEQHPQITDSWLLNFELYDKNGKQSGFRQVGSSWVATGYKKRKGNHKAQQSIVLNEISKKLFEDIISLTSDARNWMKSLKKDSWRFLLLTSITGYSKPLRMKVLKPVWNPSTEFKLPTLGHWLLNSEAWPQCDSFTKEHTWGIIKNLTPSSMRASCGVRVYLHTLSTKKMSEALGHTKYDPNLLGRYLPEPILRFFQARWIRIFQNAMFYEAMQDSPYLLDVLDLGEDELELFLKHHRLEPLPAHVLNGVLPESNKKEQRKNKLEASILVSAVMLKVLIAIVKLVEKTNKGNILTEVAKDYYDLAYFITTGIENGLLGKYDTRIQEAWKEAKTNPLKDPQIIRGVYV